ncbi:MAG: TlpA disulfide reductase family protein [Pirellulaceae bacterium]
MSVSLKSLGLAAAVAIGALLPSYAVAQEVTLTIGSDAPALDIEHWLSDGHGQFEPVKKFEADKVYVVEFWATWCGPCIASMPHLAELQEQYGEKGVQIISVSDEDLETVNGFLALKVQGDEEGRKYSELTSAYCLTTDPDQSVYTAYMEAAGQNGIPTAFVVGKDSKIEWIGHPMELDSVLEKVVDGSWDREAHIASFKAQQEFDAVLGEVFALAQTGEIDKALKLLDEKSAVIEDADMRRQINFIRLNVLMSAPDQGARFAEVAMAAVKESDGDLMSVLNIGFMVHNAIETGVTEDADLIKSVRAEVEKITEYPDEDMKSFVYYLRANMQIHDGDKAAALKTIDEALKFAPEELKQELTAMRERVEAEQ